MIAIVDYGRGNLGSVRKALAELAPDVVVTDERRLVERAAALVVPGDGAFAGSIYAALFLRKFVDAPSWAHFDIFAWAPKDKPGRPQGGEAQALRAAWAVIRRRFATA